MKRDLKTAQMAAKRDGLRFDLSPRALNAWNPGIHAAQDGDNVINILDVIGEDYWTGEGVTAKRISAALRSIGERDVIVRINSPGGDMFEGLAIYNMLREHKGEITVQTLGVAASAASIIAMAGDKVEIARAGFFMIHNAWILTAGNKNDMRAVADYLEPFDAAMADVYASRTGDTVKEIAKMMDAETWIGGTDAVSMGFADSLLSSDDIVVDEDKTSAAVDIKMDLILAKAGIPRSERRKMLAEIKNSGTITESGTPRAAEDDTLRAVVETNGTLSQLSTNFLGVLYERN
jgi:ATP-dependent Clp protease protease subunit